MKHEFIPYARQSINENDRQSCLEALSSPFITRGPLVESFEDAFASFCGATYAVAFNSGSTALHAAYHAADISPFDRVISTPNTFVATVGPAIQSKASVAFVDIAPDSAVLNLEHVKYSLEKNFSRGRPFIVPVHFAGIPVDMQVLDANIHIPDAVVIEDACHALGSRYRNGIRVGSCTWSQMTTFSFHPAKTITTGEGGMVTTNDERLCHRLRQFRNNGIERFPPNIEENPTPWHYEVQDLTGNYHLTEFQAALGLSQLRRIGDFITKRRQLVKLYLKLLKNVPHVKPLHPQCDEAIAYHLFVVEIDFEAYRTTRVQVMEALYERGIGTQVHYIPLYKHPYFRRLHGDLSSYFPFTERYYSCALSLPLYADLTEEQVERVVSTLLKVLKV